MKYFLFFVVLSAAAYAADISDYAPPKPELTCANILCIRGTTCAMVEPAGCVGCQRQPRCLAENMCHYTKCPPGQECVLVEVTCVRAPCYPQAQCRPRRIVAPDFPIRDRRETKIAPCPVYEPQVDCANPEICKQRPICPPPMNACATMLCPVGTRCQVTQVQCVTASCPPIAECVPTKLPPIDIEPICGKNEEYSDCMTACSDKRCDGKVFMCAQVCNKGCVCQPNFYRNTAGQCVTKKQCNLQIIDPIITQPIEA